jgi:hypothetical protein
VLFNATGERQLFMQAQITTISQGIGSAAVLGNFMAKSADPKSYNITLDQFSYEIDEAVIDLFAARVEKYGEGSYAGGDNREFTASLRKDIQDADYGVWVKHGMGSLFPGNIQRVDHSFTAISPGASNSIKIQTMFSAENSDSAGRYAIGKRPADYVGNSNYSIVTGKEFTQVTSKITGFIEVLWENSPRGIMNLNTYVRENRPLHDNHQAYQFRRTLENFMHVNKDSGKPK